MANGGGERRVAPSMLGPAGTKIIVAPFQFYVDGTDHLRIEAWNSATGAAVQVNGRFFSEDGTVDSLGHTLPCTADRARNVMNVALGRGFLVNLVANVAGAAPKIGQTFVRVSVIRGLTGGMVVLGVLLQGYITANQVVAWPGSPIQNCFDIEGYYRSEFSTASTGTTAFVVCPTGAHWSLIALRVRFVTSAVAANRRPWMAISGATDQGVGISATTQPASSTGTFWFAIGQTGNVGTLAGPGVVTPIPSSPEVAAGVAVSIMAENVDAGDDFSWFGYTVRERLEVG